MKALRLYGKRDLRYEEAEVPKVSEKDVLLEIQVAGICGSDLSRYRKLGPKVPGMVWGHEFMGVIREIGREVRQVKVGQRVVGCPTLICRDLGKDRCYYCQKGDFSKCNAMTVVGSTVPGGFAEYITLPAKNVVALPDTIDDQEAAMIEPAAVVLHGYYQGGLIPGDQVAVVGCGNVGLLAIKWAKILGANQIIAIDIQTEALEAAKVAGATVLINSAEKNLMEQLKAVTNGLGADCVVEAAGSLLTSAQVFSYAKKGGRVIFLGIPYADIKIERQQFEAIVRHELQVYGSWNSVSAPFPGREWQTTIQAMAAGRLEVASLISHRLSLAEGPAIFERMTEQKGERFGKVVFVKEGSYSLGSCRK